MTMVKTLTSDGVTICATIHSPTSYCFSLFDSLIMMVKGRVVYFGPRGESGSGREGEGEGQRCVGCVCGAGGYAPGPNVPSWGGGRRSRLGQG